MNFGILAVADWLNGTFYGFDNGILTALHGLGEATGYSFTNAFFRFVSYFADHGYGMILLSFLMMLIPCIPFIYKKNPETAKKVIRCGLIAFTGMALGFLVANLVIKVNVARLRPYDTYDIYRSWWQLAGSVKESDLSFPSGHTTCTTAAMTAIFLCFDRKKSWTAFLFVVLMGLSRNYLMVHYPTDILGGVIVGGVSSLLMYLFWTKVPALFRKASKRRAD